MRSTFLFAIVFALLSVFVGQASAQETEPALQVVAVGEGLYLMVEYDRTQGDITVPNVLQAIQATLEEWVRAQLDLKRLHDSVHVKEVEQKVMSDLQMYVGEMVKLHSVRLNHDCKVLCTDK